MDAADRVKRAINIDRLSEVYKLMSEQKAGCVFLAPLNLYTSTGREIPRGIAEKLLSKTTDNNLRITTKQAFGIWKEFLSELDMSIEKIIVHVKSLSLDDEPIEDVIKKAGWEKAKIQNTFGQSYVDLDESFLWMTIMVKRSDSNHYHVLSARRGKHTEAFDQHGGPEEYEHYVSNGFLPVLSVGLKFDESK